MKRRSASAIDERRRKDETRQMKPLKSSLYSSKVSSFGSDQLSFAPDNPRESSAIRDVEFIEMPVRRFSIAAKTGDALSLDDQPISRMRVRLRLLLRPLHPRIPGIARSDGFRAAHLRQADGGRSSGPYALAHPDRRGPDRDRHRDRSLPAGGAKVRTDAIDARSIRQPGRSRPFDHDQVGADRARYRFAPGDQFAVATFASIFL